MNKTFSEQMRQSDQDGNTHGMSKTTFHRARTVWKTRLSPNPQQAAKAQEMINQLDSGTTCLSRATRLLGLETPSNKPRTPNTPAPSPATIQRIAATLEGITQVTTTINNLNSIDLTPDEAIGLATRITESCKEISRIARKLQAIGRSE